MANRSRRRQRLYTAQIYPRITQQSVYKLLGCPHYIHTLIVGVRGSLAARRLADPVTLCDGYGVFFMAGSGQIQVAADTRVSAPSAATWAVTGRRHRLPAGTAVVVRRAASCTAVLRDNFPGTPGRGESQLR